MKGISGSHARARVYSSGDPCGRHAASAFGWVIVEEVSQANWPRVSFDAATGRATRRL